MLLSQCRDNLLAYRYHLGVAVTVIIFRRQVETMDVQWIALPGTCVADSILERVLTTQMLTVRLGG